MRAQNGQVNGCDVLSGFERLRGELTARLFSTIPTGDESIWITAFKV